jgi:hypothetical protein
MPKHNDVVTNYNRYERNNVPKIDYQKDYKPTTNIIDQKYEYKPEAKYNYDTTPLDKPKEAYIPPFKEIK